MTDIGEPPIDPPEPDAEDYDVGDLLLGIERDREIIADLRAQLGALRSVVEFWRANHGSAEAAMSDIAERLGCSP